MAFNRKRRAPLIEPGQKEIDYKDIKLLSRYVTERGRILPRKITGLSCKQQRMVTKAVKRARQMSLLPYINYSA